MVALLLAASPAAAQSTLAAPGATAAGQAPATLQAGKVPVPPPPADAALPQVETIISDEEFNSAIPALDADDPAMVGELESIADFERRLTSEQAGANPQQEATAPFNLPELADGDAAEAIGDAPIRDAELLAPLSPLDTFEVKDVEFAEDADDAKAPEIRYATSILGLDRADDQTETDIAGMFNDLSALDEAEGKAANVAMLNARLTEDSALLQRILQSEGWYEAKVATRVDRGADADGNRLTAVLDVIPGERFTFSQIAIAARPTVPVDLIERNIALKVGEPIVAARVQGAEAQVAVALPQQGYPFAEVGQRDILLDQDSKDGVYTLPVEVGPRARFGGVATTGKQAFDARHIAVLARFRRGDLYDSRKVDDLRQALVATRLFSTVSVQPQKTGEPADADSEYVTIAVEQEAGPPRTIAGSAGYGTGQGLRLEGSWTHRNLFPPEGALIGTAVAGTQEQGLGATFRRSNAGQRDRTVEFGINALRSDYDAYEAFTGRIGGLISYVSTPIWQKRITYAYGAEVIGSVEEDYDLALARRVDRTYFIGALTGQIGFDTSDDLLNPTKGFRISAVVQPEGSLQKGFKPYVRGTVNGSAYFPIGESIVLAGRVRVGTIQGVQRADIAPSRRLYSGGGGSVRGFGFQQLGPQVLEPNPKFDPADPDEKDSQFLIRPIGGRSVNELAAEVRYRFGNFGVVGFVDAGQVYDRTTPNFSNLRYGAGIGGRFYTNFGPLRVDLATPLGRREGESRINVYVSIGQAF